MAGATARIPMAHRILRWDSYEAEGSGDAEMNLSNAIFGFLEDGCRIDEQNRDVFNRGEDEGDEGDEEKESSDDIEENKSFWETQYQQLQATLCRTSSLESKIRSATKEAIREAQVAGNPCSCQRKVSGEGCGDCLRRAICGQLRDSGYNSAICKSKWKSSPEIPSGEHTFLDVFDNSNPSKGEVRVIIELNLRGEFEMARASDDYNKLVAKLPELFVGKIERLLSVTKILCVAAKRCMKAKKMHLAPWRKHRYVQSKWLRVTQRMAPSRPLPTELSGRTAKPRASMLTMDLLDNLPGLHLTAVEVV